MLSLSMTVCLSQSDSFFFWLFCLCFEKKGQKEGWHVQSVSVNRQQTTNQNDNGQFPIHYSRKVGVGVLFCPSATLLVSPMVCVVWIGPIKVPLVLGRKGKEAPARLVNGKFEQRSKTSHHLTASYLGISMSMRYERGLANPFILSVGHRMVGDNKNRRCKKKGGLLVPFSLGGAEESVGPSDPTISILSHYRSLSFLPIRMQLLPHAFAHRNKNELRHSEHCSLSPASSNLFVCRCGVEERQAKRMEGKTGRKNGSVAKGKKLRLLLMPVMSFVSGGILLFVRGRTMNERGERWNERIIDVDDSHGSAVREGYHYWCQPAKHEEKEK